MKYIKTFESKIKDFFRNLIDGVPQTGLIPALFNYKEIVKLESLGFVHQFQPSSYIFEFKSDSSAKVIQVTKYFDEDIPSIVITVGVAEPVFVYNDNEGQKFKYNKFEKLINKIEENVPKIDLAIKKYNI